MSCTFFLYSQFTYLYKTVLRAIIVVNSTTIGYLKWVLVYINMRLLKRGGGFFKKDSVIILVIAEAL